VGVQRYFHDFHQLFRDGEKIRLLPDQGVGERSRFGADLLGSAREFSEHLNESGDVACPRRLYRPGVELRSVIDLFYDAAAL
jgi:hypothetical protein